MKAQLWPTFTDDDDPVFTGDWAVILSESGRLFERHDFETYNAALDYAHNSDAIEIEIMCAGALGLDNRNDAQCG